MSKFKEYLEALKISDVAPISDALKRHNDAKMEWWEQEKRRMMSGQGPERRPAPVKTDPFQIIDEPFGSLKRQLLDKARSENINVLLNDVKIWRSPVGNPSGLHDYQYQLIREKFKKSGDRFAKKLNTMKKGDTISIEEYRNITRDRGKWVVTKKVKVGSK